MKKNFFSLIFLLLLFCLCSCNNSNTGTTTQNEAIAVPEVKALFITSIERHLKDLIDAVEEVGVEVIDVVAQEVAAEL